MLVESSEGCPRPGEDEDDSVRREHSSKRGRTLECALKTRVLLTLKDVVLQLSLSCPKAMVEPRHSPRSASGVSS